MKRPSRISFARHIVSLATLVALGSACTSQPTILPSRDLDRPADLTFVCLGAFTPAAAPAPAGDGGAPEGGAGAASDAPPASTGLVVSGRPMRECHPRQSSDPPADRSHKTFAFMPQSSSGQLAVVDADRWKLVDLDPQNAGYNQAPLGVLPSQITTSDDGCRLVTANHGSCDLSLVDPSALLAPTMAREFPDVPASTGNPVMTRIVPHAKGGPDLNVFPGEVAFVPHPTADMTGGQNLCPGDWTWRALVTFPSCDLVALVDVPSGEIVDGAYVRQTATGFALEPLAGRAPVCASPDCTNAPPPVVDGGNAPEAAAGDGGADAEPQDADAGDQDGGAVEAGAPPPVFVASPAPPLRPGPIAIIPETGRAYVGLGNGDAIVALDVTKDQLTGWSTIPLHDRPMGTSRLRLSIDQYGDKTTGGDMIPGRFVGNGKDNDPRTYVQDRQYLYAVARDGSVRVVQVAHAPENECETNIDPLNLPADVTPQDACIPANPTTASHRRPTALGPGIRLPSPAVDVTVADIRPTPEDKSETTVEGAHAWVLTASGSVFLVNIDPVTRRTKFVEDGGNVRECTSAATPADQCIDELEPPPNSIRNRNVLSYSLALDPTAGPPRVDVTPSAGAVGPHVESIWTQGTNQNATALTALYNKTPIFFPNDPIAPVPQAWTITWEGALIATPRLSGQVKFDQLDPGAQLFDPGSDFCRLGAQAGDLVTLTGCTNDTQCGLGKVCAHGNEGVQGAGGLPITGLCLKKTDNPDSCDKLLGTVRRYDVTKARPNILLLAPHKDELVRPNLRPCKVTTSTAGDGGADGGAGDGGDGGASDAGPIDGEAADGTSGDAGGDGGTSGKKDECVNDSDPSTSGFACIAGRCLNPCRAANKTTDCRAGRLCVVFDEIPGAVPPPGKPAEPCDTHECYCADGPRLTDVSQTNPLLCLGELLGYQVNVGRGFLVAGGTGLPRTEIAITDPEDPRQPVCAPDPNRDVRTAVRIPMDAPHCATVEDNNLDSRCNPDTPNGCLPVTSDPALAALLASPDPDPVKRKPAIDAVAKIATDLLHVVRNTDGPNACLFEGGPNESDATSLPTGHVHALFRNNEIQFMLTNLEQAPSGAYQIRFEVHGGFRQQAVIIPPAVEITMPVRIFLGPVDALPQSGQNYVGELPYLFVVDQRSLGRTQGGGPTRGQLLRIHPLGYSVPAPTGYQPTYEDQAKSLNTFPIR